MENENAEFPVQDEGISNGQNTNVIDNESEACAKLSDSAESKAEEIKPKRRPGRPRKNPLPESSDKKEDAAPSEIVNQEDCEHAEPVRMEALSDEQTVIADDSDSVGDDASLENTATESTENTDANEEKIPAEEAEESLVDVLIGNDNSTYITEDEIDESDDEMYALPFDTPEEAIDGAPEPAEEEEDDEPELPPYNPDKPRRIDARFDLVELFIVTLAIVMIISSFFFRHTVVDGASMEKTLYDREHLIISDVFYTPKRGDIIVFADYTTSVKKNLVKRVIAIEGDKVKITRDGQVIVNGRVQEEDYVNIDKPGYTYRPLEITVPAGELFVMGDHRNESVDSRDPYVGTISEDAVLGRVLIRIYPFSEFGNPDRKKDK